MWRGLEYRVKDAIESFTNKRSKLTIILDTAGGTIEVVEHLVSILRHNYTEVDFLIPEKAMSAGTVFVMAGDNIYMSYFSCLGPIDPQVFKDDNYVPALSYLNQYKEMHDKAEGKGLNELETELLKKFDLVELDRLQQECDLSSGLIADWLCKYKFKSWDVHSSTNEPVTDKEKENRANEIAEELINYDRWHSHNRRISRDTLINELKLKIEKVEEISDLSAALDFYVSLLKDYVELIWLIHGREITPSVVHSCEYID